MLNVDDAVTMIRQAFTDMIAAGLIPTSDQIELERDTVIFGATSPLDSISFVTLVSDVEQKMQTLSGTDLAVDLTEIDDFSVDEPNLTVRKLAEFLVRLSERAR